MRQFTRGSRVTSQRSEFAERTDETGDEMQAMAPLLVFALSLPLSAQTPDEQDRARRETLEAALGLASPYGVGVPIVVGSVPPDLASRGVEAWVVFREDGTAEHVVVYAESNVFICANRQRRDGYRYECLRKLASIIVHEAWHFKNGLDEAGAYEAQIAFLALNGYLEEIAGVRRARDRVLTREKRAGEEARKRYRELHR
jgi:hypothetical protein